MSINIQKSLISSIAALVLFSGCGYDNEDKNIVGNNLIITADTLNPVVEIPRAALGDPAEILAGIKSYKINYLTTDEQGKEVKASGLITIPDLPPQYIKDNNITFSIVSDQHGTIFTNEKSPSKTSSATVATNNPLIVGFSAKALFITVQPDYIGFGDSNLSHPFVLEKSLASATVDMIKASIAFSNKIGIPINGQVFLSGYSEGGYATLAAAKEIQKNHPDINLKAVAPMAGPYDLETMAIDTLEAPMMAFPPFLAYLAHSYSENYDDLNISDIVNPPYASELKTLFNKEHNATQIYMALPNVYNGGQEPDKLFVPTFIDDLIENSDNKLRVHFTKNSVIDWSPKMPIKLFHCTNDAVIPYKMSQLALTSFTDSGSTTVELAPIDSVESNVSNPTQVHSKCAPVAYSQVIPWFASIRKPSKGE